MERESLENLLQKYQISRNYNENQIVLTKLNGDQHEWPAKISSYFIQKQNGKCKKQDQEDIYDPYEKKIKKKHKQIKKQQKIKLIYKARYFQWQYYAYLTDEQIIPYSIEIENKLMLCKNKKLQRALEKAKNQMIQEQKQKIYGLKTNFVQNQKQKINQNNQNNKCKIQENLKEIKNNNIVRVDKQTQLGMKKCIKKMKSSQQNQQKVSTPQKYKKQRETASEQKLFIPGNQNIIFGEVKIKEEYQQPEPPPLFETLLTSELANQTIRSQLSDEIKQQYVLDNILFKNKYQILGIFHEILEDFSSKVLWIDSKIKKSPLNLSRQQDSVDLKKLKTLNKIVDAQIFKFQDLTESKCLQKMINIIRIGQLVNIKEKYLNCLKEGQNFSKAEKIQPSNFTSSTLRNQFKIETDFNYTMQLYKSYLKLIQALKRVKNELERKKSSEIETNVNEFYINENNKSILSIQLQNTSIYSHSSKHIQNQRRKIQKNNEKELLRIDYESMLNISLLN